MPTVKVIRIIQYEGTEEAVRKAIQLSKALGEHQYNGYVMTVAEHSNELPQLVELLPEQVENDLKRGSKFMSEFSTEDTGPFIDALRERDEGLGRIQISTPASREKGRQDAEIEEYAIKIYNSWKHHEGWVPWVTCGNSTMQGNARQVARRDLKL